MPSSWSAPPPRRPRTSWPRTSWPSTSREQLVITDAFLLASAPNDRQVKAIVDGIEDKLRAIGAKPVRREGERDGRWVLIDYAEIVVHVQHEEERSVLRPRAALARLPGDRPARSHLRPRR